MNIENAKKISLVELMGLWSYKPVKTNGVYVLYHAPYRVDKHASFKVDCLKNEWYDFSTGKGGDIIDLCKLVFNTYSVSEVLTRLDRMNLVIDCQTVSNPKPITPVEHTPYSIKDLRHPALFSYLRSRGIDIGIGEAYCKEIWYHLDKKPYFGIAFQNALGHYEVRNPYFKGCMWRKDISFIPSKQIGVQSTCCLFEGFMDFLAYKTLALRGVEAIGLWGDCDYIVLNSVNQLRRCLERLAHYDHIHCYLDNDTAGQTTLDTIRSLYLEATINENVRFEGYKDVNDFLINHKQ